jgi:hypothetical protein
MVSQTVGFACQLIESDGGPLITRVIEFCLQCTPPIRRTSEASAKTVYAVLFVAVVKHFSTFELASAICWQWYNAKFPASRSGQKVRPCNTGDLNEKPGSKAGLIANILQVKVMLAS